MDVPRLSRLARQLGTGLPRRRSLGVLALLGLLAAPEAAGAKKRRKKCKKPAPCETCPQQTCCSCIQNFVLISCQYVDGGVQACSDLCTAQGADGAQLGEADATRTSYCASSPEFACVTVPCPVV